MRSFYVVVLFLVCFVPSAYLHVSAEVTDSSQTFFDIMSGDGMLNESIILMFKAVYTGKELETEKEREILAQVVLETTVLFSTSLELARDREDSDVHDAAIAAIRTFHAWVQETYNDSQLPQGSRSERSSKLFEAFEKATIALDLQLASCCAPTDDQTTIALHKAIARVGMCHRKVREELGLPGPQSLEAPARDGMRQS